MFFHSIRAGSSKEINCKIRAEKLVSIFVTVYTVLDLGNIGSYTRPYVLCLRQGFFSCCSDLEVIGLCSALIFFPNPLQLIGFFLKIDIFHLYFVA